MGGSLGGVRVLMVATCQRWMSCSVAKWDGWISWRCASSDHSNGDAVGIVDDISDTVGDDNKSSYHHIGSLGYLVMNSVMNLVIH